MRPLGQWDEAAFDRSLAINFKGPFFLIQALLPIFGNPASIVLTTSINAHIGIPTSSIYGASKAALLSLAKTLSGELIPRGIRVNAISPGPIATALFERLGPELSASIEREIPLKRLGNPSEIARAIVFLASDEAPFTVGSELVIDGGMSTL
jgi:NAD(P)-dependent dehydrogenase (short-subunit alcohol dehydrogenase family)